MTTKDERKPKSTDYKELLHKELQDPQLAAGYLTEAFEDGEAVFLLALRDIAEARGGMSSLAKATSLNREGLYDMLSKDGNPRLTSLSSVLEALGLRIQFAPKIHGTEAA